MKLEQYIKEEQIIISSDNLPTKKEILEQLSNLLAQATGYDAEKMRKAVEHRESLMSTGIGHGLAVPHVRLEGLASPAVALGVYPSGIQDYVSLDDEPIRIVLLIAAPKGQHETYIRLLASAVEILKQPARRNVILAAKDSKTLAAILTEEKA
mgnify:CR=1 FL=1